MVCCTRPHHRNSTTTTLPDSLHAPPPPPLSPDPPGYAPSSVTCASPPLQDIERSFIYFIASLVSLEQAPGRQPADTHTAHSPAPPLTTFPSPPDPRLAALHGNKENINFTLRWLRDLPVLLSMPRRCNGVARGCAHPPPPTAGQPGRTGENYIPLTTSSSPPDLQAEPPPESHEQPPGPVWGRRGAERRGGHGAEARPVSAHDGDAAW